MQEKLYHLCINNLDEFMRRIEYDQQIKTLEIWEKEKGETFQKS